MSTELKPVIKALDDVRHSPDSETEYWMARDVQGILGYTDWRNFEGVIDRARAACVGNDVDPSDHFVETTNMIRAGKGATRTLKDYFLSRYACYLIAMNGESSKPEIATAQSYFAVKTRQMELQEQKTDLERRLEMRTKVKDANKDLGSSAKRAGVIRYAVFHDAGYRGLYNLPLRRIKQRKGIGKDDLLDRAGHAELAANYFRITQAEQKLSRDRVQGESVAIETHNQVGAQVRETIRRLGGTMPEDLPPEASIIKLEKQNEKKQLPKK
ncbi:MAG: DNA damage-inducible protein D [Candidatus Thiosymbion ectosymbiont of Robbea hypermnestra]|nr:DNA damage-inducible protein D [Candidatus Thiosymbion ectosymbiont of Robbea hypermnestra]